MRTLQLGQFLKRFVLSFPMAVQAVEEITIMLL
jgi:hypothetical protein